MGGGGDSNGGCFHRGILRVAQIRLHFMRRDPRLTADNGQGLISTSRPTGELSRAMASPHAWLVLGLRPRAGMVEQEEADGYIRSRRVYRGGPQGHRSN